MGRPGGPGPLDPIFDVDPIYGAFAFDNTPGSIPLTVTINQGASQPDPADTAPVVFDVVFSRAVDGFETGDVTLSGTAGASAAAVVNSGDDVHFTVNVTGMDDDGTIIASIASGVATAQDDGVLNQSSTSTDNEVIWVNLTFTTMAMSEARTLGQVITARDMWIPVYRSGTTPRVSIGTDAQAGIPNPQPTDTDGVKLVVDLPAIAAGTQLQYNWRGDGGTASTNGHPGSSSGDIRKSPFAAPGDRIVVAGGCGGPSGAPGSTGRGGAPSLPGGTGGSGTNPLTTGGSQVAGGNSTGGQEPGDTDGVGFGADTAFGNSSAGGGGLHGGGCGGSYGESGAGGSSYVDGVIATDVPAQTALQPAPYTGDLTLDMDVRDPLAAKVQVAGGAEVVLGFHEPVGLKVWNLVTGSPTTWQNNMRIGRRGYASPNDRFWKVGGGLDYTINIDSLGCAIPAANSNVNGWMAEGFFANGAGAGVNAGMSLDDGGTERARLIVTPASFTFSMSSTTGVLKAATTAGASANDVWYHLLIRLTTGNVWEVYADGVLLSSWAYTAGHTLNAETLRLNSVGGVGSTNSGCGCVAVHAQDRYSPSYVSAVMAAWNEV